ncbi:MAG: peptide deformylase [Desulfovibrionaceae bacterium]|jgi:peptide deformylase|nr:peptide deformylase [Desulfovibrionaceae bacterium]
MKREILTYPHPVLAEKAKPVAEITDEVRRLAEDMAETMYADKGVGLAAPQVGESVCLIVVDVTDDDGAYQGLMTLVNPEIVSREGEVESEEGCLSVPSARYTVRRAERVTVRGTDLDGKEVAVEADELLAICLQHEIDHLDGKIILDYQSRLKRALYDKKVKKWEKTRKN